jgi:hypothetical protein
MTKLSKAEPLIDLKDGQERYFLLSPEDGSIQGEIEVHDWLFLQRNSQIPCLSISYWQQEPVVLT